MQKLLNKYFRKHCKEYNVQYAVVESTNSAIRRNPHMYKDKDVLVSPHQKKGKGRGENTFLSEAGGAYFSIVYKPKRLAAITSLNYVMIAGLGVKKMIESFGVKNASLKWTNDVLIGNKKICGILCESILNDKGNAEIIIMGIGINVDNEVKLNEMIRLADLIITPQLELVIAKAVECVDYYVNLEPQIVVEEYKKACGTIGKAVIIKASGKEGVAIDITNEGFLMVKVGEEIVIVKAGEICLKEQLC